MSLVQEEIRLVTGTPITRVLQDVLRAHGVSGREQCTCASHEQVCSLSFCAKLRREVATSCNLSPDSENWRTTLAVLGVEEASNGESAAWGSGDDGQELAGLAARKEVLKHAAGEHVIAVATSLNRVVVNEDRVDSQTTKKDGQAVRSGFRAREEDEDGVGSTS
jgi:hypothetical protein